MVSKILVQEQDGTPQQIVFADHSPGDFDPTDAAHDLRITDDGTNETDVNMELASIADADAEESDKADLGENRAMEYRVRAALEFAFAPSAGEVVNFYWAPSQTVTAANGNPGGVSGAKGQYTGYSTNLSESLKQLVLIGVFVCTTDGTATIQVAEVGSFSPAERYGTLVVENVSGVATHSDDIEMHVVLDPIVPEAQ